MKRLVLFIITFFLIIPYVNTQSLSQTIKGTVTDRESGILLSGANVLVLNSNPPVGTMTNSDGRFRLVTEIGRVSLKISYLGYEDLEIKDILLASGKEIELSIELQEKLIETKEVVISSGKDNRPNLNQMATISTHTIRTEDALRYAGGFYDPSRIVVAFAGVVSSNSDYSNDIVIRGNSSRGLLWRLEGIEIPNPNHFSDGQGGSGGAFSAITSNVVSNFDFFTGAFPAEFGNAISGVMDMNLRKGNTDKKEYAFQTGMIGAEVSVEGPIIPSSGASFLLNIRYTNFKILNFLNLIDLDENNYAPRTRDLVFNFNLPLKKAGNLNLFGVFGSSEIGKIAEHDTTRWQSLSDRWEEMQKQGFTIIGAKHLITLPDSKTYLKSVLSFTSYYDSYHEGYIDSAYSRSDNYLYKYSYPTLRFSTLINHKFNARNSIRTGLNLNFLWGSMQNFRRNSKNLFDTMVYPSAEGSLIQGYLQWKFRPSSILEINSGISVSHFDINHQTSVEPRFGLRWQIAPGNYVIAGVGIHSRTEALAVHYSLIKNDNGLRLPLNKEMGDSKALHFVAGYDIASLKDIKIHFESYFQRLYDIPIVNKPASQYSAINSAERLPDAMLENKGLGFNKGIELTVEKDFSKKYYFLITGSLFNSRYRAGDHLWYSTYYNTGFVSNILAGKDFFVGIKKQNIIGFNLKFISRGGYRYTPVDLAKSLTSKRIIYKSNMSYSSKLPSFSRIDAGINFRKNNPHYSWIVMLDIQNTINRKNVFRRRFNYLNGKIITTDILSLGIIPVFNFRLEF